MEGRPYSPESLAKRWDCSSRHVRTLLKTGGLRGFQLGGKLWRISAAEVERFEQCQGPGDSSDTGAPSAPTGERASSLSAARSARQTGG
ncbi:MAG: helix-turn-helix domain-containing protein [Alphaproteobacteria bacterium]|nr:helix-turn-helix domain-containing protein [Alphaproteobacteria bacterium]